MNDHISIGLDKDKESLNKDWLLFNTFQIELHENIQQTFCFNHYHDWNRIIINGLLRKKIHGLFSS